MPTAGWRIGAREKASASKRPRPNPGRPPPNSDDSSRPWRRSPESSHGGSGRASGGNGTAPLRAPSIRFWRVAANGALPHDGLADGEALGDGAVLGSVLGETLGAVLADALADGLTDPLAAGLAEGFNTASIAAAIVG